MNQEKILITGANGQIGTVLTEALQERYGVDNVIATDLRQPEHQQGIFEVLNVLDGEKMDHLVQKYNVTQIYHLAAILSASGEKDPRGTWKINMDGLFNVLDTAKNRNVSKIFFPSSIAVFGKDTPREFTPQNTVMLPTTVYGISKVAGELWGQYYFEKYGLDVRSIRYPGIIGYQSLPGGGTTDYAVDIYHKAVKGEHFSCFLKEGTTLPMIYMPDAIRATIELMEAPAEKITVRTSYNLAGMSFAPEEIAEAIQRNILSFQVSYDPDPLRQSIAESWSASIDDNQAKQDWGWQPEYDLETMTRDMIMNLEKKYAVV
ncbi:MAG: NAD-dependent epimerase/dehydratase family protein [Saprospiraceae bacterium]|nr:NAD-dependent epimerase/dehydratase family protein [Saprospiraceae bacterium]